jgi:hypothetical protein
VGRRAVFSSDGDLVVYSIGTASAGTELRLFRIRSDGQSENIPLQGKSQDLVNRAWSLLKKKHAIPEEAFSAHLYCAPTGVSSAPLAVTFDLAGDYVSPDHKEPRFNTTRFRYEVASKKLQVLDDPAAELRSHITDSTSNTSSEQKPATLSVDSPQYPLRPASVYIKPIKCEYSDCLQRGQHGNVVVVYTDLHEETITTDGNNLDAKLGAPDGKLGWTTGTHVIGRHGHELHNNELVIYSGGSIVKRIKAEQPFIECWTWGDQYDHIAMRSREHHGPSVIEKFDVRFGEREGRMLGYEIGEKPPDWARTFFEGGWTLCR